jgi:hypothetical protein
VVVVVGAVPEGALGGESCGWAEECLGVLEGVVAAYVFEPVL